MSSRDYRPMAGKPDRFEPITFCGEIKWETAKALLVYDGSEELWLPKSQIIDQTELDTGGTEFHIPRWLAEEKGIV